MQSIRFVVKNTTNIANKKLFCMACQIVTL